MVRFTKGKSIVEALTSVEMIQKLLYGKRTLKSKN